MRQEAIAAAIRAELARQADHPHIGGVFDGDVEALAAAMAPVLFAEPGENILELARSGQTTMLDAAFIARDLLPLLKAIKPEERESVLDYLDAVPRERASATREEIERVVLDMKERGKL